MEFREVIDSGESVIPPASISGLSGRCSVGVGGVTVVAGAGMAVCGGVFGRGLASRERGLLSVRSVRMGAGRGGGASSGAARARFDERLLRLLPNILRLSLLPDFVDARSASSLALALFSLFSLFLSELKTSLKRRPGDGEGLRRLLLPVGTSKVILDSMPDLGGSSLVADSDPVALWPLTADSTSARTPSDSGAPTDVVVMRGEEEV